MKSSELLFHAELSRITQQKIKEKTGQSVSFSFFFESFHSHIFILTENTGRKKHLFQEFFTYFGSPNRYTPK